MNELFEKAWPVIAGSRKSFEFQLIYLDSFPQLHLLRYFCWTGKSVQKGLACEHPISA